MRIHHVNSILKRRAADLFSAVLLLFACILLVSHRSAAQSGVLSGVHTCLNLLVPSLFPFVLFACVLTQSHASALLFRPLAPVMRQVFRLPACAAPALLFGLTLGYPVGARITAALYADGRLSREQAARLLCICTAPGYAFSLYAGAQLAGGMHGGLLLFWACAAAPLLLGLLLAPFAPKPSPAPVHTAVPGSFSAAVRDGTAAMVTMCSFLVVFSAGIAVLQSAGVFRTAAAWLCRLGMTVPAASTALLFFLEVTAGLSSCAAWQFSPATAAFGLGFAGLCIHLQLLSFFKTKPFPIRLPLYLVTRFLNGLLCAAAYTALSRLFPRAAETAASGTPLFAASAGSPALSAALLALSVFFLTVCARKDPLPTHPQ